MEIETILRELASVVNRAWYKCEARSPNSEMLMALSSALSDAALEHQQARERQESIDREMAAARDRHDKEERELQEKKN